MKLGMCALTLAGGLVTGAVAAQPAGATGPGLTHYSVHFDDVVSQDFGTDGPCGEAGTVTMTEHVNAVVSATQSGLTDEQVIALLHDDPDGVLRQLSETSTGDAVVVSGAHTYTGRFTSWFGGHFMPNGMYVQTGTFSFRARSELGTPFSVASGGHALDDFDGLGKMFNAHGHVNGCLPPV